MQQNGILASLYCTIVGCSNTSANVCTLLQKNVHCHVRQRTVILSDLPDLKSPTSLTNTSLSNATLDIVVVETCFVAKTVGILQYHAVVSVLLLFAHPLYRDGGARRKCFPEPN